MLIHGMKSRIKAQRKHEETTQILGLLSQNVQAGKDFSHVFFAQEGVRRNKALVLFGFSSYLNIIHR